MGRTDCWARVVVAFWFACSVLMSIKIPCKDTAFFEDLPVCPTHAVSAIQEHIQYQLQLTRAPLVTIRGYSLIVTLFALLSNQSSTAEGHITDGDCERQIPGSEISRCA